MWNTKIFAILLGLIIFGGILALTYSLTPNFVTISSTGQVLTTKIMARSGSPTDIQAAINSAAAAGGGAVYIPAGTFYWNNQTVTIPGGVSVFGASSAGTSGHPTFADYNGTTILHNNAVAVAGVIVNDMFVVSATNGKPVRISGIQFEGTAYTNTAGTGIAINLINTAVDFRIDHNTFYNFAQGAVFVSNPYTGKSRGVIDHNRINNPYKDPLADVVNMWGYGIVLQGQIPPTVPWDSNINDFLGKYESAPINYVVVYIEDNHFSRCRHAVATNQEAWYVARFNLADNPRPRNYQSFDVHGAGGSSHPGGRGLEAYNNTIIGSGYGKAIGVRGGGGVIYNNTFRNFSVGTVLWNESGPSYSQVHDLYIWSNTGATTLLDPNGEGSGTGYVQNVNYFLYAKPSYTPYPYPHPLTLSP